MITKREFASCYEVAKAIRNSQNNTHDRIQLKLNGLAIPARKNGESQIDEHLFEEMIQSSKTNSFCFREKGQKDNLQLREGFRRGNELFADDFDS
jgi:ribosomal protein S7